MNEERYCLKCIKIDIFLLYFNHSFIQSAVFTGRAARQTNCFHILRMIVELTYLEFDENRICSNWIES